MTVSAMLAPSGGDLGWCGGPNDIESFQPRLRFEPLEGFARLGEKRFCVLGSTLCGEPFGVFELGGGVVEGEPVLGKDRLGGVVVALDLVVVAAGGGGGGGGGRGAGVGGGGGGARGGG